MRVLGSASTRVGTVGVGITGVGITDVGIAVCTRSHVLSGVLQNDICSSEF